MAVTRERRGLNEELVSILNTSNEKKAGLLTEHKIVNIKILREYLDSLNLHRTRFEMNKFVVKQKKLKNISDIKSQASGRVSQTPKQSIFNSYKQKLIEGDQENGENPASTSFYFSRDSSGLFNKAFHKYDSSVYLDSRVDDQKVSVSKLAVFRFLLIFSSKSAF